MNIKPTESELEILQVLWKNGPCSVRVVNDVLNVKRPIGYTTTLKIMQIMTEKGIAKRDTTDKTHIYYAGIKEKETKNSLLKEFINSTFHGSSMSLVMQALGNTTTTEAELQELKALIDTLENK